MLKVFEAFSGIGSQTQALKNIGVEHEVVAISEIDKYAIASYEAIHGPTKNLGDISQLEDDDVPECDLFTYSFPCFVEGTKVLTTNGYKNIEEISVGDEVITHKNRIKKVKKTFINQTNQLVHLSLMSSDDIITTPNHPFYVRKRFREWDNLKRRQVGKFKQPCWVDAKDLTKDDYLGTPINTQSEIPKWNGVDFKWSDGRKTRHVNELQELLFKEDFWYIMGRYIGDGWKRSNESGIIICCGKNNNKNLKDITSRLERLNVHYSLSEERTVYRVIVPKKEWFAFFSQFGDNAHSKHLTRAIFNAPVGLLKHFIDGYIESDGYYCERNKLFKISSVSDTLIYDIAQIIAKVYKRPFSVYKTKRKKYTKIEGRIVNQRDTYTVTFKKHSSPQDKAFYENGYIWSPLNKIQLEKLDTFISVYNMEVEDDNSYVVQNVIVHNCQDISLAGKQQGLNKGINTRSSLLWDCEKVIRVARPKYLLLENVKNLVSKKHKHNFDEWLKILESYGYNNYWKVLNAKDYGIPQNRERVFVVSIRKDVDDGTFEFPKSQELKLCLKDMLENEVNEKFYLSKEIQDGFVYKPNNDENENEIPLEEKPETGRLGQQSVDTFNNNVDNIAYGDIIQPFNKKVKKDITPTLTTRPEGLKTANIVVDKKLRYVGSISNKDRIGDGKQLSRNIPQGYRVYDSKGIATTQTANGGGIGGTTGIYLDVYKEFYRLRKLTPRECWRLMGFKDEQFEKAQKVCSNTQLYKQAGNSIVVNVLEAIFSNIFLT